MRIKNLRGVSELRFKKTRLLHLGNIEKPPYPQFFAQRAPEGQLKLIFINCIFLKSISILLFAQTQSDCWLDRQVVDLSFFLYNSKNQILKDTFEHRMENMSYQPKHKAKS